MHRHIPAALVVAALAVAASAEAAIVHRYVAPSATGNGSGLDPANRATLSWANSNAVAGWVVHLAPGVYPSQIDPANGGTAAERIVFVGDDPVASRHVVTGIQLDGPADWVTVRGIRANGRLFVQGVSGNSADHDSVLRCVVTSDVELRGANRMVIQACSLNVGSTASLWKIAADGGAAAGATNCRFDRNVLLPTCVGSLSSDWRGWWFSSMDRCTLTNNYLRMTIAANTTFSGGAGAHMRIYYGITNNVFMDNRADLYNEHAGSFAAYALNLRDGVRGNTWVRDSTYDLGAHDMRVGFATNGNYQSNNTFDRCLWKVGLYFLWSCTGGADNVRFDHCQFIARNQKGNVSVGQSMFYFVMGTYSNLKFNHCTFYNGGSRLWDTDNASPGWSTLSIKNCLFISRPGGNDCYAARLMDPAQLDFDADSNLYFLAKQRPGDSTRDPNWTLRRSAGCAQPGPTGWPCTSYNNECASRYGDPLVVDTTWVNNNILRPNLQPLAGSPALGALWRNGYVGALPAQGAVVDVTAPAAIQDLGASPGAQSAPPAAAEPSGDESAAAPEGGDDQAPAPDRVLDPSSDEGPRPAPAVRAPGRRTPARGGDPPAPGGPDRAPDRSVAGR